MTPWLRKLLFTVHLAVSVGWLGAVVSFLGLAALGLSSTDPDTVRGVYLVMEPVAWFVLVPLALASLATGVVQALGTPWGLIRHYWVLFKLVINICATLVLLTYMRTFDKLAAVAADPSADLDEVRSSSPLLHAAVALVLLVLATILATYKPKGLTPYGYSKRLGSS